MSERQIPVLEKPPPLWTAKFCARVGILAALSFFGTFIRLPYIGVELESAPGVFGGIFFGAPTGIFATFFAILIGEMMAGFPFPLPVAIFDFTYMISTTLSDMYVYKRCRDSRHDWLFRLRYPLVILVDIAVSVALLELLFPCWVGLTNPLFSEGIVMLNTAVVPSHVVSRIVQPLFAMIAAEAIWIARGTWKLFMKRREAKKSQSGLKGGD